MLQSNGSQLLPTIPSLRITLEPALNWGNRRKDGSDFEVGTGTFSPFSFMLRSRKAKLQTIRPNPTKGGAGTFTAHFCRQACTSQRLRSFPQARAFSHRVESLWDSHV